MVEGFYKDNAKILRWDGTLNASGEPDLSTTNWDEVTTVKGILVELPGEETYTSDKETQRHKYELQLKYADLRHGDRVEIDETTYEVLNPYLPGRKSKIMVSELERIE